MDDAQMPVKAARKSEVQKIPMFDEWMKARTVAEGREMSADLWADWAKYVSARGNASWALYGWKTRSITNEFTRRGYKSYKHYSGRYILGISLRPSGELAPTAPAGKGAPVVRVSQDVL